MYFLMVKTGSDFFLALHISLNQQWPNVGKICCLLDLVYALNFCPVLDRNLRWAPQAACFPQALQRGGRLGSRHLELRLWEVVIRKAGLSPFMQPRVIAHGFLNTERF